MICEPEEINETFQNECAIPYKLSSDVEEEVKKAMHAEVTPLSSMLKVLADPIRIRILKVLGVCDLCVCVLVEITDYKYSALSYHLKLMKDAGLIDSRREGSYQVYYLTDTGSKTVKSLENMLNTE